MSESALALFVFRVYALYVQDVVMCGPILCVFCVSACVWFVCVLSASSLCFVCLFCVQLLLCPCVRFLTFVSESLYEHRPKRCKVFFTAM